MACVEEGRDPGNAVHRCHDPARRRLGPLGTGLHRALVRTPDGNPAGASQGLPAAAAQRRGGRTVAKPHRIRATGAAVAVWNTGPLEAAKGERGFRAIAGSAN